MADQTGTQHVSETWLLTLDISIEQGVKSLALTRRKGAEGVRFMAQARLPTTGPVGLSEIETRCLRFYGIGWSRNEISDAMRVSRRTVGSALTTAKEKLGARSLAHAAILLGNQGQDRRWN